MSDSMSLDKQESGTALAAAFMRALAACDPREELRGKDHLAEIFLMEEQKRPLKEAAARAWVMKNKVTPGAYEFMIARTAFFDQIVEQALKETIGQLVFLGAGYDSRPYRFEKLIRDTRIFELDTQPTQQRKQLCLEQAHIVIPGQVKFLPVNLGTDNLAEKLLEGGFDKEKRTVFIWEGVTYYLNAEDVDNVLFFAKEIAPAGSSICFDYAALSRETLNEHSVKKFRDHMRAEHANEPTRFGVWAGEIAPFLSERGYEIVEHLTADEMTKKYLPGDRHLDIGKVPPLFCLVHAQTY